MLAQEPLDRDLLYSLALAQFKLGEYGKCRETLAAFFDVPASEPKGDAADKEQQVFFNFSIFFFDYFVL